jgi:hypothetical protein
VALRRAYLEPREDLLAAELEIVGHLRHRNLSPPPGQRLLQDRHLRGGGGRRNREGE